MSYSVYLVTYEGMPRDHHAIFFQTNADESGFIYQVSGNIQQGMKHDHKRAKKPENSDSFVKQDYLGKTSHAKYPRVEGICNAIEPPQKQFEGAKRLYPHQPLRRCQEWTKEVIDALKDAGILEG